MSPRYAKPDRPARQGAGKRIAFVALMLLGLGGFLEAAGAIAYYSLFSKGRREVVEATLGLDAAEYNSVLRYRPHPYFNHVGNPDYAFPDGTRPYHPIGIRATDAELTDKPSGVFRVVALGGSTTYGMYFRDGRSVGTHRPVPALARAAMRWSHFLRALGVGWMSRSGYQVGDMAGTMRRPVPPDEQAAANAGRATGKYYRRNLSTLTALIRLTGAEPVLVDNPLNPALGQGAGGYFDAVSAAVRRNNRIMHEVGREQDVAVIALYDRMRDPALFQDAVYMNQEGMLLEGKLVAEALVPLVDRLQQRESGRE
jgi:hypothetical protein